MSELLDRLEAAFTAKRPEYEAFVDNLKALLQNLLEAGEIEVVRIEGRAKGLANFRDKISRPSKQGKYHALEDITDLAGLRIVVYYQKDVSSVIKILESNFEIDTKNSTNKAKEIEIDRLGYQSIHYIVSHSAARRGLDENKRFQGMKAEIQVSTVLQHAWAVLDRRLRYNNNAEMPDAIKRILFLISGQLETADILFTQVDDEVFRIRKEYGKKLREGQVSVPINVDSLTAFVTSSSLVQDIISSAKAAGLMSKDRSPTSEVRDYSRQKLVDILDGAGIKSISEFENILQNLIAEFDKIFMEVVSELVPMEYRMSIFAVLRALMFFSDDRNVVQAAKDYGAFSGRTRERILAAYGALVQGGSV
ncbi:GTP pyrophosphokinase [Mesorhizobium amorphae]|uniref:GTP pyrophosphokinase n=1 Tax=Mesorhizobium amorphae TaxID=71433 RepID=UPI00177AF6A0|nr:RelA/SpoT domain-containing protein [Mesorhizobium amorphae]